MDERTAPAGWQVQTKPPVMSRRYDFPDYAATRSFLDDLARLSETSGYYPDLNFAKTHVSVTVAARDEALGSNEYAFAERVDALAGAKPLKPPPLQGEARGGDGVQKMPPPTPSPLQLPP